MSEAIWFTDALARVHIDPATTGAAYGLVEMLAPHGHMPPPHTHSEDEAGFVLEGELTVHLPDGVRVLRPGDAFHAPAGTPHTLRVTSAGPVRALIITSGGDFPEFLRRAGRPAEREALPPEGPVDVAALTAAAEATGMAFVDPALLPSLAPAAV